MSDDRMTCHKCGGTDVLPTKMSFWWTELVCKEADCRAVTARRREEGATEWELVPSACY